MKYDYQYNSTKHFITLKLREQGHRGESKIVRGNRDFPTPSHWTWSSGQVKSVRKCNSCRDCSRHNVGYNQP